MTGIRLESPFPGSHIPWTEAKKKELHEVLDRYVVKPDAADETKKPDEANVAAPPEGNS